MGETRVILRRRLDVRGQVQGVGFRPYVYRVATALGLAGHVANNTFGAAIEIEGPPAQLDAFELELLNGLPPLARIVELRRTDIPPTGETRFAIVHSHADAGRRPEVTPDAATCPDCLRELLDPADRRHAYPFINCTNCGPRYSIIRTVPYDRPATTMAPFTMCPPCQAEYDSPADRRFHAQPNACAVCGPTLHLELAQSEPEAQARDQERRTGKREQGTGNREEGTGNREQGTGVPETNPIPRAAALLRDGAVLAVKGIGGYHLACRADREDVVRRLRERKLRDGKPLALMVPDLAAARTLATLAPADETALRSPAAPIVLLPKRPAAPVAPSVAPGCDTFGVMLPYAPVHHLLFAQELGPLVMTSANLAGQPLTYRDEDARRELADVADAFLLHNREIFRPIDDSVIFTFRGDAIPIRRARGYAPAPLRLRFDAERAGVPAPPDQHRAAPPDQHRAAPPDQHRAAPALDRRILAVGAELKSTVCLLAGNEAIISEHLGDLTNPAAYRHFVDAIARLSELLEFEPQVIAHDLHPLYLSTRYAQSRTGPRLVPVQHHHAHILSVLAEHGEPGPVVGLACDGVGYGTDGAVWGGEVLYCHRGQFQRWGHLQYFPLVGGDAAAIETWRPAAALVRQAFGETWRDQFNAVLAENGGAPPSPRDLDLFDRQAATGMNAPPTSSLGRVFDAVAFLLGLCPRNRHEAEAAMAVEAAAAHVGQVELLPALSDPDERTCGSNCHTTDAPAQLSLAPVIREIVAQRRAGVPVTQLAAGFHESIARLLANAATRACAAHNVETVALSGGCFANRRLLARLVELLESDNLRVLYHTRFPSGDGGLALGQALAAAWVLSGEP